MGSWLNGVDRAQQSVAIVGKALSNIRSIGKRNDHSDIIPRRVREKLFHFFLSHFKSGRLNIRRLHTCRIVDDVDTSLTDAVLSTPAWSQACQNNERQEQQLQIKKQVFSKALPNTVDVNVFHRLLPKKRAWNYELTAFQFEKVEA